MTDEAMPPKWYPSSEPAQHFVGRLAGHAEVIVQLRAEAQLLLDEAFRHRTLNAESQAKVKEEQAEMLLTLVASLPTKLRAT